MVTSLLCAIDSNYSVMAISSKGIEPLWKKYSGGANKQETSVVQFIIGNVLIDINCYELAVQSFTNLRKSFGGFSGKLGGNVTVIWLTFAESRKLQKMTTL